MSVSASNEEPDKLSTSIPKERRFKLSRACDRCRRRRIKCDEGHPCQACLTASAACTFEEPGKRTHPHKSKRTATLEDRMHHLETLIQAIPPAVFAAGGGFTGVNTAPSDTNGTSPLTAFASPTHTFPSGVPPPSLHVFPLMNPSTHFTARAKPGSRQQSPNAAFQSLLGQPYANTQNGHSPDHLVEEAARMSLSASYLYFDDEGYTRWQGETSGLPLLDVLVERHGPSTHEPREAKPSESSQTNRRASVTDTNWFPNRTPRRTDINPETLWRLITSYIVPELMDSLVQCYLSTSYYILPFLHVPTFLADYGNPQKWGEPGFGAFIVAICCLASRHMDDPRVRADPNDGISAGTQWFELFGRLRTLPIADRPTLYTIQADLVAGVYAVGLGKLSKAAALMSEAITVSVDTGLHRSADTYDCFDPIEDEVRKRTFWCVYMWDKQLAAHFGRPPMIRLRDCDVGEPSIVDDEFITAESIGTQPAGTESRMSAFVCAIRILVVLESVVDVQPTRSNSDSSPFMIRASSVLAGTKRHKDLRDEEALLDDIHCSIPAFWAHSPETLASEDVIRLTQAERLHCAEHFTRLLIYRHRFSEMVVERMCNGIEEQSEAERDAMSSAQNSALQIIAAHLHIATKGLMTYYGVHVIHQLTQAGRTLMAILLNCKFEALRHLIAPSLDALRSCVGLLRRFSGRYVCGLRSGDLMEEFCRLTQIPLEPVPRGSEIPAPNSRPPWIRPIRKKTPSAPRSSESSTSQHSSPEGFSPNEFFVDVSGRASSPPKMNPFPQAPTSPISLNGHSSPPPRSTSQQPQFSLSGSSGPTPTYLDASGAMSVDMPRSDGMYMSPAEIMAFFNTDGNVDVGSLFPPDFLQPQQPPPPPSDGGPAFNSPFKKANSDSGGAMGVVASP